MRNERIGKVITDFRENGDYDAAICYAEFEIAGLLSKRLTWKKNSLHRWCWCEKESYFYYYHNFNMCDCIWNSKTPKFELFYGIKNELGISNAYKIQMHRNI